MKRICIVCGDEFELKPDHKGLATMCSPKCQPLDKPKGPHIIMLDSGERFEVVRDISISGFKIVQEIRKI